MKLRTVAEIIIVLILSLFLSTPAFSAFSYAWCVSDDGHSRLELVAKAWCSVDSDEWTTDNRKAANTLLSIADQYRAPCFDYYIEKNEATPVKRFNKSLRVPIITRASHEGASVYSFPPVGRLVIAQPPRVAQTLIAHRTVVLRN